MTLPHEGLSRDGAAALALEVSRAPGYRGEVVRLVGAAPDGDGWAVRVRAIVAGGSRLLRSRAAWDAYRATAARTERATSHAREVRQMIETSAAASSTGRTAPQGGPVPAVGAPEAPLAPATGGPATALGRWRTATEAAIAEAEREAERLLARAGALRTQAAGLTQDVRLLRRALAMVPDRSPGAARPVIPAAAAGPTIRDRVLEWIRAHDGALVVAEACTGLDLSVKQVSDAASQLVHAALLERIGKGRYRVLVTTEGAG